MYSLQLQQEISKTALRETPSPSTISNDSLSSGCLLPPAEIFGHSQSSYGVPQEALSPPADIQRPRSALHSGNFTEGDNGARKQFTRFPQDANDSTAKPVMGTSPKTPWYTPSVTWRRSDIGADVQTNERYHEWADRRTVRSRAPSLQSYSSSYILKAPTTPLVQQSNSEDLDLSNISPVDLSSSPSKKSRRHTLPPNALSSASGLPPSSAQSSYQPLSAQRVTSLPYQAHRPRRSLTSTLSLHTATSPQTPGSSRARRSSHSSDAVNLQHASMVGSYEESILRGWMSTAPSKPLDFTAQIGVLGRGGCKPKCPAHVTVPFPAVFYSYNTGTSSYQSIMAEPSPYVGQIDLNQLPSPAESNRHKRRRSPAVPLADDGHISSGPEIDPENDNIGTKKRKKRRRTSPPPQAPPGGSYRIPEQGQLQIIIKNPNKTAVKLFLVPYDLTGMEAGTKTFIRQRCYSAGPSVDYAITSKGEGSRSVQVGVEASKKPTLRYLIHVNICSPSKGRFYLYQHMRVVFANRVPDNKEQLQNEIQLPQPRFSAWKPNIESLTPSSNMGVKSNAEKAYRRRSSGFGYGAEAADPRSTQSLGGGSNYAYASKSPPPPVPAIPFSLAMSQVRPHDDNLHGLDGTAEGVGTRQTTANLDPQSPLSDTISRLNRAFSGSFRSNSSNSSDSYTKLNKGENGYGGLFGRPNTPEPGEGLLARRLKRLGLERGGRPEEEDVY
jgi:hypothetical protein